LPPNCSVVTDGENYLLNGGFIAKEKVEVGVILPLAFYQVRILAFVGLRTDYAHHRLIQNNGTQATQ
jgi:hypothetical protein